MSWVATTLALVGAVVVAGLWWYERSRPPARMVALVAALAALAVAGRLVFAAIPNVVATTDIVLITGFALGAAPGFAVGALAALVSNMWLGQGPWTPWEMAAWGLVGVGGAALAGVTGGRIGRIGLATACGLAGLAYGALLDLSVMVTYGGEQSLDRYLALSARGVPFNIAHAAGNVALALAAGPALVRMIARYRHRFEFTWHEAALPPIAAGCLALVVLAGLGAAAPQPARAGGGPAAARSWLVGHRNGDGGFGATPGDRSSPAMTGWAVLGLEGAGLNPLDLHSGSPSPIAYLRANADRVHSTGDLERTILALAGAGLGAHHFGGQNLVAELEARRDRDGSFDGQVNLTAFGILALDAAGQGGLSGPAHWLASAQRSDGGWGFQPGAPSDADSTGAALQGLAAAGRSRHALGRGTRYLRRTQDSDGGFALSGSSSSNAQSTSWAVQGLAAAGANPAGTRSHGRSPIDYLAGRQAGDGHYAYSAASDQTPIWVTAQALLAVERRAFPLPAVARAPKPAAPRAPAQQGPAPSSAPPAHSGAGPAAPHPPSGQAPAPTASRSRLTAGPAHGGHPTASESFAPASAPVAADPAPDTARYVLGGLGVLAALLVAGFFVYRRRLP